MVERQARAIRLRTAGVQYADIASTLGCSVGTAHKAVQDGLRQVLVDHGAEDEAAAQLLRLDDALRALWPSVVGNADVVDIDTRVKAIDRLIRIERRRADLLGLDAPKSLNVRADVRVVSIDAIQAEIARLEAELGTNDPIPANAELAEMRPSDLDVHPEMSRARDTAPVE